MSTTNYCIGWDVGGWLSNKNVICVAKITSENTIDKKSLEIKNWEPISYLQDMKISLRKALGIEEDSLITLSIDAPLSYSADFKAFVNGSYVYDGFIASINNRLLYRDAEREINARIGVMPLSGAADKLGHAATLAQAVVATILKKSEVAVSFYEVYPGIYKNEGSKDVRVESFQRIQMMLSDLGASSELLQRGMLYYTTNPSSVEKRPEKNDYADAFICCVFSYWLKTKQIHMEPLGLKTNDGLIYVPADLIRL